jgi:hypothetical protein
MALKMTNLNIDDEWSNFLTNKYEEESSDDENNNLHDEKLHNDEVDEEVWHFGEPAELNSKSKSVHHSDIKAVMSDIISVPEPTDIYISTKSKIAYLAQSVDLKMFWDIPVIPYSTPQNGVIKKQIKINSKTPEELELVQERLQKELYYDQHIMSHIDNPNGRIKFKDIRKITIGVSKKDIMSYRSKKKQAFYNCFVMILRIKIDELFREFHIKVFNTGKLEIPGVQSEEMFGIVLNHIVTILQPFYPTQLKYFENSDTVLINSNFNCGFYINREVLYDILRSKYNIQAIYDPCSYPGIQCKFYYNNDIGVQTGMQITTENKDKYKNITEVSFMIFRTGSVLIVGMCDEHILQDIYQFLKALLKEEFKYICQKIITPADLALKDKKKKIRRKTIHILTGAAKSEEKKSEEQDTIVYKPTKLQILENPDEETIIIEIQNLKSVKKPRKPRQSKKALQLEIVEEA